MHAHTCEKVHFFQKNAKKYILTKLCIYIYSQKHSRPNSEKHHAIPRVTTNPDNMGKTASKNIKIPTRFNQLCDFGLEKSMRAAVI